MSDGGNAAVPNAKLIIQRRVWEAGGDPDLICKNVYHREDFDLGLKTYNVKAPVFPFSKFPGVDVLLGPEMKSTGEVMGRAPDFSGAYAKAMTERAKVLVVETCEALPYVYGEQEGIHISEVDHVIDGGRGSVPELANPPVTEVDRRVASLIAAEIEEGACLQIGIGGMPNAVCAVLKDAGIRDLGVHTEMFVDGMVDLVEAGVVTGARKTLNPYQIVFTFAAGSRRTYDFIERNPGAQGYPVDYTNLPENIMRNPRVVSINNTTQMDLQGQAASESDGHRHLTGTGGQLQFVRGAYASNGGKAFICLASTYEKGGQRRSRIVSSPTPGNIVTTPRTDVMYVVTEYGLVNLKGKSVAERAKALISLAHPDFREQLAREAREHKLVPRAFW